ncbi:MAG: hypothetical protein DCF15_18835 [Phormidesmis priestleyi]|uniref:Uncharacterized protein n=1 Tax=Phormidesmis priestleyi TaxID=268141 RepID=A0A2W4WRQ6_9CYAN|nr:MAG: hypothetical protein DCF15_18835 [Phormidesmis priestleyi]
MERENDYSHILEKVLNDVEDLEKGVLFTCIKTMIPTNADEIIQHFLISPSGSYSDDLQVLTQASFFQPILKRIDPIANVRNIFPISGMIEASINFSRSLTPKSSAGVIVIVALLLIGTYFVRFNPFGKSLSEEKIDRASKASESTAPYTKEPLNLCLIIPCNRIIGSLRGTISEINLLPEEAAGLVNSSIYFLGTTDDYSSRIELNNNWEELPEGDDLFVQLHVPNGGDLIKLDLKRSLSRAVSNQEGITIQKKGLLKDLNGLQNFNRA